MVIEVDVSAAGLCPWIQQRGMPPRHEAGPTLAGFVRSWARPARVAGDFP